MTSSTERTLEAREASPKCFAVENSNIISATDLHHMMNDVKFGASTKTEPPFKDANYDAIVSNMAFENTTQPTEVVAALRRLLRHAAPCCTCGHL